MRRTVSGVLVASSLALAGCGAGTQAHGHGGAPTTTSTTSAAAAPTDAAVEAALAPVGLVPDGGGTRPSAPYAYQSAGYMLPGAVATQFLISDFNSPALAKQSAQLDTTDPGTVGAWYWGSSDASLDATVPPGAAAQIEAIMARIPGVHRA